MLALRLRYPVKTGPSQPLGLQAVQDRNGRCSWRKQSPARRPRRCSRGTEPAPDRPPERRAPSRHTYGALDLGTNNCRLLIARPADGGFTVVDAFSRIVRLGEGLSQTGALSRRRDGPGRRRALASARDKLRRRNVSLVALGRDRGLPPRRERRASSSSASATETGIVLDIIDPQEEARLAVLGCHKLLEPGDGPALIFDIGGGSTELVLVDQVEGIPEDPQLVERAMGRRFADRKRGPERARGAGPARRPMRGCASARGTPSPASPATLPERRGGHPAARAPAAR